VATVAITGATGFIGRRLLTTLADDGWRCRVLVRRDDGRPWPPDTTPVAGSLEDENSLERLVTGVDAVVHCAGRVRGATRRGFSQVNAEGTARLVQVLNRQSPPPYTVMLSSLAAREPRLSAYAASKREAERRLALGGERLHWAILRPPAVYGPGDRELLPLFRALLWGVGPVFGAPGARLSLIHVDDLVAAIHACLRRRPEGLFELHDGKSAGYDWADILAIAATVRGGPVRRLPVPGWLLGALGRGNLLFSALLGRSPMLTPGKVRELRHPDWVCDNAAFSAASGWVPRIGLAEGLRQFHDTHRDARASRVDRQV